MRRSLILVVRAMNAVFVTLFAIAFISSAISLLANFTLIQNLKDFYPQAYSRAGSPTIAAWLGPSINIKWNHYLLSGKFRSDSLTPPQLMEAYKFAFWSGWFKVVSVITFFIVFAISLAV